MAQPITITKLTVSRALADYIKDLSNLAVQLPMTPGMKKLAKREIGAAKKSLRRIRKQP